MNFNNRRLGEEWERLQVEMLRAQVTLETEKAEQLRLSNVQKRRDMERLPALPAFPAAAHSFWGGAAGVTNVQGSGINSKEKWEIR